MIMNNENEQEFIMKCIEKNKVGKITKDEEEKLVSISKRPLIDDDETIIRNNIWLAAMFLQYNCGYNVQEKTTGVFRKTTNYICTPPVKN